MARFWVCFLTQLAVLVCVRCDHPVQSLFDQFCTRNPTALGCKVTSGDELPGRVTGPRNSSVSCSATSRECLELPSFCVPREISCTIIGSGQRCNIPEGYGYSSQVLMCGDGAAVGIICGNGSSVPVLTQLLVQCHGADLINIDRVTKLGVVSEPGKNGVAGVYRCNKGSWDPLFGSRALRDLTHSCSSSGCGRVPQPVERAPVFRRWSWVRAIYHNKRFQCTGTIVSPCSVLTAAHCVTGSLVSKTARPNLEFQVELPGPNLNVMHRNFTPSAIHIHPQYNPHLNRKHDMALLTFRKTKKLNFPVVCVADSPGRPPSSRLQVVFGLQPFIGKIPEWINWEADWDPSCKAIETRTSVGCNDQLIVHTSQFCASHPGLFMFRGSSGGPYLVEVGNGVEETWVVLGVLSHFSNESACDQDHSVYSMVAEDSMWVKNRLSEEECD